MLGTVLLVLALLAQQGQSSSQNPPTPPPGKADKGTDTKGSEKAPPADSRSAKPTHSRVNVDLSGFDLLDSSKLRKKTMVPGHARGIPHPVLLAPKLGKLFGFRPSFAWDFHGEANIFVFILRDDQQQEVFRAPVRDKHYVYPADAPTLAPGKTYFWSIEVESPELTEPSEPVGFIVLGPEQRTEIEKKLAAISTVDPFQAGLARARLFTDYRVWYDAIAAYSDLITRFPGRLELYEERGTIYAQLPITSKLADRDFARVQDLKDARKTPN